MVIIERALVECRMQQYIEKNLFSLLALHGYTDVIEAIQARSVYGLSEHQKRKVLEVLKEDIKLTHLLMKKEREKLRNTCPETNKILELYDQKLSAMFHLLWILL